MMKTLKQIFVLFLVGVLFASCDPYWHFGNRDDDGGRGYILSGRWFGDLGMHLDGVRAKGSVLDFVPSTSSYLYGTGRQTDYFYDRFGILYPVDNYFDWEIRDRSIYMFYDNPDLNCRISDYRLSPSFFEGYIDGFGSSTYFRLWNYDRYWPEYGYWDAAVSGTRVNHSGSGSAKVERRLPLPVNRNQNVPNP